MVGTVTNAISHLGVRRVTVAHFLIAEVLLLAVVPFVDQLPSGELTESAMMTFVLGMAVFAVGGRRTTLITATILWVPAAGGPWQDHFWAGLVSNQFTNVASMVFLAFIIAQLLRFILRAPRVDNEVLCAGVATYLLLGMLWAFAYMLVSRLDPNSFLDTRWRSWSVTSPICP